MNPTQEYVPDEPEVEDATGRRRPEPNAARRLRRPQHIRNGRPNGFNGKHRRRNKRYGI